MRITRQAFEGLVAQALDDLPDEFAEKIANVEVVIEDRPTPEDLQKRKLPPGALVLGTYRGIPLTEKSVFRSFEMPPRIVIFQHSLEQFADTPQRIIAEVRRTVLHEIAHHFGISDKRLRELGY